MKILLLGVFCLVPAVFTTNISDNTEEVGTTFIGRIIYIKWCGPGNEATNYDDLGENRYIDACCRDHDKCDLSVESGNTKYGLTNTGLYTVSGCKCDQQLRYCLEKANSWVANMVISAYAFTNQQCLMDVCDVPYVRCPRDGLKLQVSSFVFEGVTIPDNITLINESIRIRTKKEKEKTDESMNKERSQFNQQSQILHSHTHPVPYYVPYFVHAHSNIPYFYPRDGDYSTAPESNQFNLPSPQDTDYCYVDEFQQL